VGVKIKIIFIGTVNFSLKALEKLIYLKANIIGVITKESSKFNSDFADLTKTCEKNNIPCFYLRDINSKESLEWVKSLNPDICFCFGWSSIIKKEFLEAFPRGVVGYHPTKLPKNRGRHPLIWTLVLGLKKSASTFFFMDEGVDSGDIISQVDYPIIYEDDAQSLYNKITEIALSQITSFLPILQNNDCKRIPQDHGEANLWRKRGHKDGLIDFRMSGLSIYNLVRGLTKPYVGAHVEYKNKNISIWIVEEIDYADKNIEPGKIIISNEIEIIVKTYNNAIRIIKHGFDKLPKTGEYL